MVEQLERLGVRPHICRHIRSGPLGPRIDGFVVRLTTSGYATRVVRRRIRAAVVVIGASWPYYGRTRKA
jgi:hypothetical protein